MKKLFALLLVGSISACDGPVTPTDNTPDLRILSDAEIQVSQGANDFAFNLLKNIQKQSIENEFISPLSVSMALAMTMNGAAPDTQQSILNTIDYGNFSVAEVNKAYKDLTSLLLTMDSKVQLGIANSVWYSDKYNVHTDFSNTIAEYYDGVVKGLDFSNDHSKDIVNQWVENKTNGRIKELLSSISADEIMFLINAIYFKGEWTYQFDKSRTHQAPFYKADGTTSSVDMMFSKGVKMRHYQNEQHQLFEIPYGNQQFNFTILMPHDPADINEMIVSLSADALAEWLHEADSLNPELELPKFKMEWKVNIKDKLESMGMKMTGFPNLFEEQLPLGISRVIHQTFLDVNEEGSEAAAATAVGIELTSIPDKPTRITIDKPFIFMIREKHTGVILFIGQFIDPDELHQ